MTDHSRARIDSLLVAALDCPSAERAAFLGAACEGDQALQARVEELLRLAEEPDAVFDVAGGGQGLLLQALLEDIEAPTGPERLGDRFGRWRLVRELGRGGMGTVYLAERTEGDFEQTAALKLLQAGDRSEETLRHFERERQILASLEHPNIARLIDGGRAADGRPYLAMEYVVGRRMDDYVKAQQLSIDQRIELFLGVAHAVQSAHRSLVVHRDLKPSNILVTAEGTPKLLDFGIAELLEPVVGNDASAPSRTRALTPEYASPEQVRGQHITTASDVYQLGLLLFELLTGERAQRIDQAAGPSSIERAVCERETPRPSITVAIAAKREGGRRRHAVSARRLAGDLDAIVLRALHKEPERRYGSVHQLSADLERFRHGFPVEARPDTVLYRASSFVKRNRVSVGAAVVVTALLAGYALTVTLQERRIQAEANRAREAVTFVTQMFNSAERGELGAGRASALDVIDQSAERATSALASQPDLQAEILTGFGQVYMDIGRYDRAIASLETALDLGHRSLPASDPRTGRIALLLGMNLHYAGRLHDAEPPLREARGIYLAAHGPSHPSSCLALTHLGDLLHTRGDLVAAGRELRTAYQECSGALALRDLANVQRDRGDLAAALAAYPRALEQLERDDPRQVGFTYYYWGYALTLNGDLAEAARAFARSREIILAAYGEDHPVTAIGMRYEGRLALARGDAAEAERLAEQSLIIHRRWLGDAHHLIPRAIVDRASVALAENRTDAALAIARDAISRYDTLQIPDHPMALEARQIVGAALLATGDLAAGAAWLRDVIARQEALFVPDDARLAAAYALLAEALDGSAEAETLRGRARASFAARPMTALLYCRMYQAAVAKVAADACRL